MAQAKREELDFGLTGFKFETLEFELYYETHGAGEPLILIPGFASGAWIWLQQVEDLANNFQVVTFDPRGVSHSKMPGDWTFSLLDIVADTARLLDDLKIEKANILGASFGGFVAQEFALAFPERVGKLILACTSSGGKNHVAPDWEVLMAFTSVEGLNNSERIRKFMIPAFTPQFRAEHDDIIEKVCELRAQNAVPENVYLGQLQAATTFDAEARVQNITAETLVLTGDADAMVPPQNSRNLADAIPDAKLKIIKNGGHLLFIEKAAEFNQIVTEFIKQN